MRINSRVFTERADMLDIIRIPTCPTQFRAIAENIIAMATKPGYSVPGYNTMTQLDKILMVDYWIEYDGFTKEVIDELDVIGDFRTWFIKHATPPELIRRARQFLVERNYLIVKESVAQHALQAGEKFSKSIRGRG